MQNSPEMFDLCVFSAILQWHQAVVLAKSHNLPNIDTVLASYATHLLDQKKIIDAVQLYPTLRNTYNSDHCPHACSTLTSVSCFAMCYSCVSGLNCDWNILCTVSKHKFT